MNLSTYFLKWLKSPYEVRNQTLQFHFDALKAGKYECVGLKNFFDITAMIKRMADHQEETTRRRLSC